ncbi:MAG TPA: hypothetical protein PKA13_23575 [Geminicoccaceae bacterium]|nr:hypothetical protein [Geminicoccus sp.]HMU52778.1 hypothetical protein [Geminicoccaceae bacterium]
MPPDLEALLAGRDTPVRLWWRDDDAGRDHPRLARLLEIAERHGAPLALAVVPSWLEPAARARIARCPAATVLQHGIAHRDHAAPGERKIELGGIALPDRLAGPVVEGRERLAVGFGARFREVMVPPWNRIAPAFLERLPAWGFAGFSGWADGGPAAPEGISRVDTHLDLVSWRPVRRCLGLDEIVARLAGLLQRGAREPLGLLSHHLVIDEAGFETLDRLIGLVQDHPKLCIERVF